jgi:hypothetical protein
VREGSMLEVLQDIGGVLISLSFLAIGFGLIYIMLDITFGALWRSCWPDIRGILLSAIDKLRKEQFQLAERYGKEPGKTFKRKLFGLRIEWNNLRLAILRAFTSR